LTLGGSLIHPAQEDSYVGRIVRVSALSLVIIAGSLVAAQPADAESYWPADGALWCWNHQPVVDGYTNAGWRSPQLFMSGQHTFCAWWYRTTRFTIPVNQQVDWEQACQEQYGPSWHNVFAPGWPYLQACRSS
jgi:hypothetical protein